MACALSFAAGDHLSQLLFAGAVRNQNRSRIRAAGRSDELGTKGLGDFLNRPVEAMFTTGRDHYRRSFHDAGNAAHKLQPALGAEAEIALGFGMAAGADHSLR